MLSLFDFIVSIILVILIIWYFDIASGINFSEGYLPCGDCPEHKLLKYTPVINPYIWPYSATDNIDALYSSLGIGDPVGRSVTTPDHAPIE